MNPLFSIDVVTGARVSMTAKEVDALIDAGNHARIVLCSTGQLVSGYGSVGLIEVSGHHAPFDLNDLTMMAELAAKLKAKREELASLATNSPSSLYEYTAI